VSQIGRNTSCPCESGRKYKRCCGAARPEIDPGALSRGDMAVGDRIQEWAYTKHPDEMDAALGELVGDPHGVVFGDTDTQLVARGSSTTASLPVAARRRSATRGCRGSPIPSARSLVGSRPRAWRCCGCAALSRAARSRSRT